MILKFNRIQDRPGRFEFTMTKDEREIEKAEFVKADHTFIQFNNLDEHIEIEIRTLFGKSKSETGLVAATINTKDEKDALYYCKKKGSNIFNGIYYWMINYQGKEYYIYEVGLGRKGIYYCIWENNKTVAIISKNTRTKHFESEYDIYSEDDVPISLLIVLNLFIDITRYYPSDSSEEWHTLNTWQKELKSKYDKDFIERIRRMG